MKVGNVQNALHELFMKKIMVFVNPKARQGGQFSEEIENWLNDKGFHVLTPPMGTKIKISDLIEEHAHELDAVLIGGGDGSVNEALPALLKTQLPLLVIPLGTANNLARTLEIPTDLQQALSLLLEGEIQTVDVGMANDIPFMNVAGLGLSTQVNRLVRSESKKILGVFAFIWMALKVALRMTPFRIVAEWDGKKHKAFSWQVSICNGRNYGNGLVIHEKAGLQDQTVHGLSTEIRRWWHFVVLVPGLLTGRFQSSDDVTQFEGKEIVLTTRRPMKVDVDGDIKTKTPLRVRVLPRALRIFTPKESLATPSQP
jgi:YegS/Rv2252/BmrU family lipid kinase